MNETTKVLCERRSVRSFTDKQVPKDILDEILKCGCYAPSGMGLQSAVIVAIQDKDLIDKIAKINASIMGRDTNPFYGAPTLVVVLAKKDIPTHVKDGSSVITNILNMQHLVWELILVGLIELKKHLKQSLVKIYLNLGD